jgi:hypothetical protein
MSIDPTLPQSRRAILAASLGGIAALAAKAALGPTQALAGNGDTVRLGMSNIQSVTTSIQDTTSGFDVLTLYSDGGQATLRSAANVGAGIVATSVHGEGVAATSTFDNGVHGSSGNAARSGVWGANSSGGYGVSGSTGGSTAAGVWGSNSAGGQGVRGTSISGDGVRGTAKTGVGVRATADPAAVALRVDGRAQFQRSGRAKVSAGQSSVVVTMAGVTTASYVIATVQANVSGLYVRGVVPANGSLRIYLSKAVAATAYVGFLVVN